MFGIPFEAVMCVGFFVPCLLMMLPEKVEVKVRK